MGKPPLHEWKETFEFNYNTGLYDLGTEHSRTTWIFEAGSFVPCGKITNGKHYSIITDHLGTPIEAYNQEDELIWEREQDRYGNSQQGFAKENFRCPFKYQGQYYDSEVELCYNRFRYYHPETGRYISEDPIKLLGGFNVFAYVGDSNAWVDVLGLDVRTNKEISIVLSEPEVKERMKKRNSPTTEINSQVRIYIYDEEGNETKKYATIDNIAIEDNPIRIVELVDAKNGNGELTKRQQELNENGGIFKGSSRASKLGKKGVNLIVEKGSIKIERTNFTEKDLDEYKKKNKYRK